MLFVLVNAHSERPEVFTMGSTSTYSTITVLQRVFA